MAIKPEVPETPGQLLKQYRGPLSQDTLADRIGITTRDKRKLISNWENNVNDIPGEKMLPIKKVLKLTAPQFHKLLIARFPALDLKWLSAQEAHKQGGLLLAAYRERLGLKQQDLAEEIKVTSTAIGKWERGEIALPPERQEELSAVFARYDQRQAEADRWFGDKEANRLQRVWEKSNAAIEEMGPKKYRMRVDSTKLGAALPPSKQKGKRLPPEDMEKSPGNRR